MTFFSRAARVSLMLFVFGIGACSSTDDTDLYGYEESFVLPKPDMIPVTPDDKPGRTVDEMLELTPSPVTVKKGTYRSVAQTNLFYERAGRFGSKEKVSLRKGLNVPEAGIVYGAQKRKSAEEIRSLEVKKQEKDFLQTVSEEEMLAQIIAPKTSQVEMIEVVPIVSEQKDEPERLLPLSGRREKTEAVTRRNTLVARTEEPDFIPFETKGSENKEIILPLASESVKSAASSPVAAEVGKEAIDLPLKEPSKAVASTVVASSEKEPVPVLTFEQAKENSEKSENIIRPSEKKIVFAQDNIAFPLVPKAAELPAKQRSGGDDEKIVLLKPPASSEAYEQKAKEDVVFLKPFPVQEEAFVLVAPEQQDNSSSVEIFLDDLGV